MEGIFAVSLAGLVLPPGYALRLGALGLIGLGLLGIYGNIPYSSSAGTALGEAMLFAAFLLWFGGIAVGLAARWVWSFWHGWRGWAMSVAVPAAVDIALVGLAMVLPAGMIAVLLGAMLAGQAHPLAVHLGLLGLFAVMALASVLAWRGQVRAAVLALSLTLATITVDSMRLDAQIRALLPKTPHCLAIGPGKLPPDQVPPLMGLTAPKPILLVTGTGEVARVQRWSFRWHGFVRTSIPAAGVPCAASIPPS